MNPFQQLMSSESKPFSYNEIQDDLTLEYPILNSPVTTPIVNNNLSGVYSNTGFDMIQILSRLIHR